MGEIIRRADAAMYSAEFDRMALQGLPVHPQVTLINMTSKPIQTMAAATGLYAGDVFRSPEEVPVEAAKFWLKEMQKTKLKAGMEFIDFHFLLEGVTRGFTHQLVRQRTAVFVQESQRFAVKENAAMEIAEPPSIACLKPDDPKRAVWTNAVYSMVGAYLGLVNSGVPAEDARSLLPTNITTRVHYKTTLRGLYETAGMRLCSQAQFEWKAVWYQIIDAILNYDTERFDNEGESYEDRWQQEAIADLFKPVCYQTGRCEFRGDNDRHCSIRDRVESHYKRGEGPQEWLDINPLEPVMEGAARKAPGTATIR